METGSEVYLTEMLGFDYNDIDAEDEEIDDADLVFMNDIAWDFNLKVAS